MPRSPANSNVKLLIVFSRTLELSAQFSACGRLILNRGRVVFRHGNVLKLRKLYKNNSLLTILKRRFNLNKSLTLRSMICLVKGYLDLVYTHKFVFILLQICRRMSRRGEVLMASESSGLLWNLAVWDPDTATILTTYKVAQ